MKKLMLLSMFFFLISCASTGTNQGYAKEDGNDQDFATLIVQVIIKNIDKIPNKRMAVLDFTDINGEETAEGRLLAEQVIAKLSSSGEVTMVEREKLDKVLKEQELNASGVTENQDEEAGKVLNVDAIISGTIASIEDNEEVNARMIDVKTGEIYCAANGKKKMKLRQKEFETLPQDQKETINKEITARESLKNKNPQLYKTLEDVKKELWRMRLKNPQAFQRVMKIVRLMERLKNKRPRIFLAVTAPEGAPLLEKIKHNKPEDYKRILLWKKGLAFILEKAPGYKNKIMADRQQIITQFKER